MANANTIAYAPRLPGANQGVSSAAAFQFQDADGANAVVTVPAGALKAHRFRISCGGRVKGQAAATTFTPVLHCGAALGTDLFSGGACTITGDTGAWFLEVTAVVDAAGDEITGVGHGSCTDAAIAAAVANAASQDPDTALSFSVEGTMSTAHADNMATMEFFEVEVL